ncbi:MAG: hypothetical protein GY795_46240 [Desulfobacterales bacterium]|nr:hypothetical protein [Desulfobacterales bacterium]
MKRISMKKFFNVMLAAAIALCIFASQAYAQLTWDASAIEAYFDFGPLQTIGMFLLGVTASVAVYYAIKRFVRGGVR